MELLHPDCCFPGTPSINKTRQFVDPAPISLFFFERGWGGKHSAPFLCHVTKTARQKPIDETSPFLRAGTSTARAVSAGLGMRAPNRLPRVPRIGMWYTMGRSRCEACEEGLEERLGASDPRLSAVCVFGVGGGCRGNSWFVVRFDSALFCLSLGVVKAEVTKKSNTPDKENWIHASQSRNRKKTARQMSTTSAWRHSQIETDRARTERWNVWEAGLVFGGPGALFGRGQDQDR